MAQSALQIVLAARPQGAVKLSDFRLQEASMPTPSVGEILLEVLYLSLDPYMRGRMDDRKSYADPARVGDVMPGQSVCKVITSNHPNYAAGEFVVAFTGWQTHFLSKGERLRKLDPKAAPISTAIGVLGMPGFTAYSGLKLIGKPARGETVVVAAAAGAVGSLVGQLAQIYGAKAVGIAGGPQKCAFVKEELGFDAAVDHHAPDFPTLLAAACPAGVDVYFENVGGAIWQAILPLLNQFARVPISGVIAHYDGSGSSSGGDHLPGTMRQIVAKRLVLQGFINSDFAEAHFGEFLGDVSRWVAEGRVRYREDIVEGLENAPKAFIGMLSGKNFGKALVHVANLDDSNIILDHAQEPSDN
jgi:NADPH-dependent curcumin reductase